MVRASPLNVRQARRLLASARPTARRLCLTLATETRCRCSTGSFPQDARVLDFCSVVRGRAAPAEVNAEAPWSCCRNQRHADLAQRRRRGSAAPRSDPNSDTAARRNPRSSIADRRWRRWRYRRFRIAGYSSGLPRADWRPRLTKTAHRATNQTCRRVTLSLTAIGQRPGCTMRTLGRLETYPLQVAFWLMVALGVLALLLACRSSVSCSSTAREGACAWRSCDQRRDRLGAHSR